MRVVLSVAAGLVIAAVLWVIMVMIGPVVNFLFPEHLSSSDGWREIYDFLKWVVPIAGGLVVAFIAYGFLEKIGD